MSSAYLQPVSTRRRATAIALTLALHIVLALLLLNLAPDAVRKSFSDALSTFNVAPDAGPQASEAPTPQPRQRERERAARPAPPRPTPPVPEVQLPAFLRMTREQFAGTDVSRITKPADRGETASADTGGAEDSKSSYGPGAGPGGARLYNAEWYREPTRAELVTYLPAAPAGSWGEVACRTIPDNRVENCQILGESPLGSKLATGIRRAAWQFRVRPPRRGGKPLIGEWVRIRIEFTERGPDALR